MGLSNMSIIAGRTVTQAITPHTTPFAITSPRSSPRVKVMKHIARKPATVVKELPTTAVIVAATACAIASCLLSGKFFCCSL